MQVLFGGFRRQGSRDRDILEQILRQPMPLLQVFRAVV